MSPGIFVVVAGLLGIITGFVTIHSPLAHSSLSILLWVIVGIAVVAFSPRFKTALYAGAVFGFFDIASWLISGFQGTPDKLPAFMVVTLLFSILGAVCGLAGGYVLAKLFKK